MLRIFSETFCDGGQWAGKHVNIWPGFLCRRGSVEPPPATKRTITFLSLQQQHTGCSLGSCSAALGFLQWNFFGRPSAPSLGRLDEVKPVPVSRTLARLLSRRWQGAAPSRWPSTISVVTGHHISNRVNSCHRKVSSSRASKPQFNLKVCEQKHFNTFSFFPHFSPMLTSRTRKVWNFSFATPCCAFDEISYGWQTYWKL